MAKDFGDDTLPINPPGHYFPGAHTAPVQVTTWDFLATGLSHLLYTCVSISGQPGWAARLGNVIVAIVPMESAFRRRWWRGDMEVGGGNRNGTGWLESE